MILCKKVFPSSTLALSSIIPAKGRHNLNNAIAPSNSNLHKACQLLDVAIIDNTSSFVAPSGAPRLALYRDPFHPSVQGTAKLAVSMKKMLANWQPDHFWRSDPGRSDRRNWPQANHHASLLPAQDSAIREQVNDRHTVDPNDFDTKQKGTQAAPLCPNLASLDHYPSLPSCPEERFPLTPPYPPPRPSPSEAMHYNMTQPNAGMPHYPRPPYPAQTFMASGLGQNVMGPLYKIPWDLPLRDFIMSQIMPQQQAFAPYNISYQ
ncbi:hypothetical protein ACOMHN_008515 [Nucella lapillus]